MKKVNISIQGMHCASCSSNVEKSLSKVSGVSKVKVSLLMNKASAECEDNVKEEVLKEAIKRVGYETRSRVFS